MPGIQTQVFASANGGIWRGDQDKTNLTLIVAAQAADDFSSRMRLPGNTSSCTAPTPNLEERSEVGNRQFS
ncbi:hypothetical protein LPU83_pLPU83d_0551 (plasmid) [Rhizobium favelukesii]|uniref:Uncharacterized protein n=1 Tax=Rhizobium favelukesii TaxID=348824 RepID=W6RLF9_9HYPH|nr:hypothetical protein LPU83_pLPU83d_0551 [Rhizobium favelukesii]